MRKLTDAIVALGLIFAACGCTGQPNPGSLTILVSWSGPELDAFTSIVHQFQSKTGITVNVTSTRALTEELDADKAIGIFPDLAALPSIGAISSFESYLQPLTGLHINDYDQPWPQLMKLGGTVYAVPVKIDIKSLIWYDPAIFRAHGYTRPTSWNQLVSLDKSIEATGGSPWCLAVSSTPTSGWPGTDWISDIMLSMYGQGIYQRWVSGTLPWTSLEVKRAWETWGNLITDGNAVYNGLDAALLTNIEFGAPYPKPSECYLQHGTLVDEEFPPPRKHEPPEDGPSKLVFKTDYNFFEFPSFGSRDNPIQVSADFMGMFKSTPQAKEFVNYMMQIAQQNSWVKETGLDGFSADNRVLPKDYPDPVLQDLATLLTPGRELCFGASDAMPPDLSAAFDKAILEYLADPAPKFLTGTILPGLENVQKAQKLSKLSSPPQVCGTP